MANNTFHTLIKSFEQSSTNLIYIAPHVFCIYNLKSFTGGEHIWDYSDIWMGYLSTWHVLKMPTEHIIRLESVSSVQLIWLWAIVGDKLQLLGFGEN